jgi:hypothetical protein
VQVTGCGSSKAPPSDEADAVASRGAAHIIRS